MKRALGIALLVAIAAGAVYGFVVTQREASYRLFVEQGDAALVRDDSYAAIEAFSVAISLKSDSMAAHLKRGEAYRRRGEFEDAVRDLRHAADLDPNAVHPRELLGDVHYAAAAADGASARARFARAVERYRESVGLDDRSARLQYKLGLAAYRAGQLAEAVTALREAIRLEPRLAEAHYALGLCHRAVGRNNEAVRTLERAVALSSDLLPAREELADLYLALRRPEERLSHLEALAALQPSAARDRALAEGYARAGNMDRAVGRLANAANQYSDDGETYVALGRLWLERAEQGGRVELGKALEALQANVGNDSSSAALTALGRALLLAGHATRARQTLQQATVRFPVDPDAFLLLADASHRLGYPTASRRALLDYAALVSSHAMDAPLLARVGEAYLDAGDTAAARRSADAALAKDSDNRAAQSLAARLR